MKKPHVLNRPMFNRGGISAYGRGITSNLVSDEQRQRFNDGGRVGLADGTQFGQNWQPPSEYLKPAWEWWKQGSKAAWGIPGLYSEGETMGTVDGEEITYQDPFAKGKTRYYQKKAREEEDKRLETEARTRPGGEHPLAFKYEDPVVKEGVGEKEPSWAGIPEEGDVASDMLDVKKELDPKAGLTGEPEEGRIEKMLEENLVKSKQRAKIAALTRGVSMASNLLDKPTFAKAFAAAGKEAPLLAKETAAAMKGAETLPLQWEMIKEKIALTGEEAVRKAEVGEKRKGEYQTAYIDILRDRLDMAKADPDLTVGDLFSGEALKLSGYDQAKLLKELASQKGLVIKIKAIDTSKPENYKNLNKGTIVRDTIEGEWYFIEEKGVLGVPKSQKEITDGIDLQVQKTLSPGR